MAQTASTILFAGGGTGGHIYPNLAIYEQLRLQKPSASGHFVVSARAIDAQIMAKEGIAFTPIPATPVSFHPIKFLSFVKGFVLGQKISTKLAAELNVKAVVCTGGFASAPVAAAAIKLKLPLILVNLDAVPGKVNKWVAKHATEIFTAYPHPLLPNATHICLPLRQSAIGPDDQAQARLALNMKPDKPLLLITGASQGASTLNKMMMEIATLATTKRALGDWQIYHLAGVDEVEAVQAAYDAAGLDARVQSFCDHMGMAWRSATLAISRCGAGSVAEVWANSVPTIFLPYPFHKDEHQKLNAQMLVDAGASLMMKDLVDPLANARQITGPLVSLMGNSAQRQNMIEMLQQDKPAQGATEVARWLSRMV